MKSYFSSYRFKNQRYVPKKQLENIDELLKSWRETARKYNDVDE